MLTDEQKYHLRNILSIPDQLQEYCRQLAKSTHLNEKQLKIAHYVLNNRKEVLKDKYVINDELVVVPTNKKGYRRSTVSKKWEKR